ncbi:hypothetical protein BJ170DRAFT_685892 [Xylariales sp. AK1849]|nr:hypothetical protein BJ170DRAFT_685892 [Xylariales sp. AK1849]
MAAQLRRCSLTDGDGPVRRQLADLEDIPPKSESLLVRLPRSQSTSNMLDAVSLSSEIIRHGPRDAEREKTNRGNLRDLAQFFRTTVPLSDSVVSSDDCFGVSGSEESRKRSIQSLISKRRVRSPVRSPRMLLEDDAVPGTTAEGCSYVGIAIPGEASTRSPWFRSQDRVSTDDYSRLMVAHPRWPERTTSKGALSTTLPGQTPSSTSPAKTRDEQERSAVDTPGLKSRTGDPSGLVSDGLASFSEARLVAEHLAVDPRQEHGMEKKEIFEGNQGVTFPEPPTTTQDSIYHGVIAESPTTSFLSGLEFERSEVKIGSAGTSPVATPRSLFHRRKPRSLSTHFSNSSSPNLGRNHSKKPTDIMTEPTLAVPKEASLPESPGFPSMFAAMSFPSPPRTAELPSSASTNSYEVPIPFSAPTVRPRTSSKNAITSPTLTASLDEIVVRRVKPGVLNPQSDRAPRVSSIPQGSVRMGDATTVLGDSVGQGANVEDQSSVVCSQAAALLADNAAVMRPDSVASFTTARERHSHSSSLSITDGGDSYRRSIASSITTTADSYRKSISTINSKRQSTRGNAIAASTASTTSAVDSNKEAATHIQFVSQSSRAADVAEREVANKHIELSMNNSSRNLSDPPVSGITYLPASALAVLEAGTAPKPLSIAERRIVRRGKVRHHETQSLDMTRASLAVPKRGPPGPDSIDSPVLGRFYHDSSQPYTSSLPEPLPLAQMSPPFPAMTLPATEEKLSQSALDSGQFPTSPDGLPLERVPAAISNVLSDTPIAGNQWCISHVMISEITPEASPEPSLQRSMRALTVSALMVVANLEPQFISTTPVSRVPTLLNLNSSPALYPPLRSPLRPRVEAELQNRQRFLSAQPARLPSISATEPKMSAANDARGFGRSSTPTLPPSSHSKLLKRFSLPLQVSNSITSTPPWDRTPGLRRRNWLSTQQQDREPGQRRRSIVVKERFQKEKMEKEKQIAELVARTTDNGLSEDNTKAIVTDEEDMRSAEHWQRHIHTANEIERRLQHLEKHSDDWLSVLQPLLDKMTRTLKELRKEDESSPLLMGEFIVDMAAEARRSMYNSNASARDERGQGSLLFEDFDGAYLGDRSHRTARNR